MRWKELHMVSKMPGKRTLRILICDADREFVQAAERILGSEGHTVVAEANLCKAARLALQSTPDVVVLPSELMTRMQISSQS